MATMETITGKDRIKTITTHYIDGEFVESHGRETMDIISPTSGNLIGRVTLGDEEDTRRAIAAAKRSFATYGRSTKEERAKILRRLHEAASARLDDLTAAMVEEYGGVVQFARPIVESGVNAFLASEKALQELPLTRSWGKTTVTLEPVGVAGLITAWNANALFICLKLASAVAAGCTVVIKPSELSSLQTRVLIEALHEADLPKGLLNVVTGLGNVVGAELVRNPDVAKISFTGSVAVGEKIMRDGAETMKRVTLELGGKSPTILLDDAVLDQAIPSALGMAFLNSGQACAAGTRLLVPKSRLDTVKRGIRDAIRAFTVGDPADPKTAIGPMVSQKQYERVQSYIHKGIEEGAEVLVGGDGHPPGFEAGYFVKPTVFVNVKNDMTIAQEEIFGPVLCVIAYDSEDEAIRIANDSKFGLHASVLGTDLQRARRVASQIRAGRVVINGMLDDPQAPWGGFKYSGIGREYGRYGIEAFLETRAILES
ncbi:MAG TPA: aldehyde dehydrogenase family protein [Terriglobia bacterium]|nr:aldehyde dehydrogenase family protein [Terriglobia bacterium]